MASSGYEGFTIWFTGMSGAGKSTLANYIGARLVAAGKRVEILDGDDAGQLLGYELGETPDERDLASRRVGFVARLLSRNGVIAIGATVSPHRALREELRREIGRFVEIFTDCEVDFLIKRDVKGLYKRALAGELPHFVGITEPYEPPAAPEVTVDTSAETVQDAAERIIGTLQRLGFLTPDEVKVALFGKTKEATAARRRAAKKAETAARAIAIASAAEARRKAAGLPSSTIVKGRRAARDSGIKARAEAAAAAKRGAVSPSAVEPAAVKPAAVKPAAKKAATEKAATEKPKAAKQEPAGQAAKKTPAAKPQAKKPEVKKAAAAKPQAKKPKTAAAQPKAKKAEVKKTASAKPQAKKPEAKPKKAAAPKAKEAKKPPKAKVATKRAGKAGESKKGQRRAAKVVSMSTASKPKAPAKAVEKAKGKPKE